MSNKLSTLEDFMKKYISNQTRSSGADSFNDYKYKNGIDYDRTYAKAMESLYLDKQRNQAGYGQNYRKLSNQSLQNSGYAKYITDQANYLYNTKSNQIKALRDTDEAKAIGGYQKYLSSYNDRQNSLKESVASHLISNSIVNINDAISYGLSQGLSTEDALAIGKNVYSINKQKVFNDILYQVTSYGLDKDGVINLAKKMGITDEDAQIFASEIDDLISHHYESTKNYLDYLEQKSDKTH